MVGEAAGGGATLPDKKRKQTVCQCGQCARQCRDKKMPDKKEEKKRTDSMPEDVKTKRE